MRLPILEMQHRPKAVMKDGIKMQITEKYLFDREKALEICYKYYRNKGYSEDHCRDYLDRLEDFELKRVYTIIMGEFTDEENK